jgi:hypothetical protein
VKSTLRAYAQLLSEQDLWSIVDSYDRFEAEGFIGDEPCRRHAEAYCGAIGTNHHITMWMQLLAFECYRRIARSGGAK